MGIGAKIAHPKSANNANMNWGSKWTRRVAGAGRLRICARLAAGVILATAAGLAQAEADVIYTWQTLTATVGGNPVDAGAVGQIVLTDAGFASGSVSVATFPDVPIIRVLNGIVSASFGAFGAFGGPIASTSGLTLVNFAASVNGDFLDVVPNNSLGGFFYSLVPHGQYFGVVGPGAHVLTIGFGTDNPDSACNSGPQPQFANCVLTGFFQVQQVEVPEPGSLAILAAAFSAFGALGLARRRKNLVKAA